MVRAGMGAVCLEEELLADLKGKPIDGGFFALAKPPKPGEPVRQRLIFRQAAAELHRAAVGLDSASARLSV